MTTAAGDAPTLATESERLDGLYVPAFAVTIGGTDLPAETLREITSVSFSESINGIDGFELTVSNGEMADQAGRYVGAENADDLLAGSPEGQRFRLFEPSRDEVVLSIGYRDEMKVMTRANIVTMEPDFPAEGPAVVRVRGLNVLHRLRRKPYSTTGTDRKDSEIAAALADLTDPDTGQQRFPIPVRVNDEAKGAEEPIPFVLQENQHDVEFLLERARLRGYVVYVADDADEPYLYFGPSGEDGARGVRVALEWGRSLLSFRATLAMVRQPKSVTVRGWDRTANQLISEKVLRSDARLDHNPDLERIVDRCDPQDDVVVEKVVSTAGEARALATDLLRERQRELVKASGSTVGMPCLRVGAKVSISGVGARFSGVYFVTDATHVIDAEGYRTHFRARREEAEE